jgi:hypothetical protein
MKERFSREMFGVGETICILNVYKTFVKDSPDIQMSVTVKHIAHTRGASRNSTSM